MDLPQHLVEAIKAGQVCLVLGAGCSLTSTRAATGKPAKVIPTTDLCRVVCEKAGFPYGGEGPRDVFQAVKSPFGPLSDEDLKTIFEQYFLECLPANELNDLVSLVWRRIYTFNIDDTIRNTRRSSRAQTLKFINAMRERRKEWSGLTECQVVYLHGYAGEYESGVVFSRDEYSDELLKEGGWYGRLGEDFISNTLCVIGSSLDEPIVDYQIKRLSLRGKSNGFSYVVTPSSPSPVLVASLKSRGFIHLSGSLEDFVHALKVELPDGMTPSSVRSDVSITGIRLSPEDIEGLRALHQIKYREIVGRRGFGDANITGLARKFFDGYGPELFTVAKDIPATLKQDASLEKKIEEAISHNARGACLLGEAGSGKSTFLFRMLMFSRRFTGTPCFLYQENSTPIESTLLAFDRYLEQVGDAFGIVLIDDVQLYAEQLAELFATGRMRRVRILTSARKSDWSGRLSRYLGGNLAVLNYERFDASDVSSIIDKLVTYYPSPSFVKLPRNEQLERFHRSKRQLLIALREATRSERFDDTIRHEVGNLEGEDVLALLAIASWATVARVGIKESTCAAIFSIVGKSSKFEQSFASLSGIIDRNSAGRLAARHELYADVILDSVVSSELMVGVLNGYFSYYSSFEMPVIRTLDKADGQLFKYSLNYRNIYSVFDRLGQPERGSGIYERFSVDFQLDGHFWLQWGLYNRKLKHQEVALDCLVRSVEAYPENGFARHALAQQRLIVAGRSSSYGVTEQRLIKQAVDELLEQHRLSETSPWRITSEEYPLVTLSMHHTDALLRLRQDKLARKFAEGYFSLIEDIHRRIGDSSYINEARERLFKYVTLGEWVRPRIRE